ncbi:hypothetical protein KI809_08545 [Geobacter pelophilus]|uniref:Uncharacterized protein n=1 Tax=Geoanaerobacter pelophilus TaxID=60036 RepID=A0AAW4L0G3_9BACT|nr:hypothetical protein [Geoanaerobacter pelophilus]MBT0664348.1 hypothetical protein [Geoanaerobacter pelophilus]
MIAKYIAGKGNRSVLDYNDPCPFHPENGFEEAFLFYLHKISSALEDTEAAISGELDNCVEIRLMTLEETLTAKLDAVIEELRQLRPLPDHSDTTASTDRRD